MKRRFIGVIALCLALFGFAPFSQIAFAGVTTQSFSYTGASQTWTVPTGITSLTYVVIGADGGGTTGGHGESMTGTLTVTPGQLLYINVGQQGSAGCSCSTPISAFNGGGSNAYFAGGGGGASDIRTGVDTSTQLVVAGGGGGSGNGGNAGFLVGSAGGNGQNLHGETGGGGGTQSSGGVGGTGSTTYGSVAGAAGGRGFGGNSNTPNGAGGGGGYYGGGSGGSSGIATGGGGGSSWYNSTFVTVSSYSNTNTLTNGFISLSYIVRTYPSISLALNTGLTTATYRSTVQIQVTVSAAGYVRFYNQGKTIATCQRVAVIGSTATCNWKPTIHGVNNVTASFTPTDMVGYFPTSVGPLGIGVNARSNNR